MIFLVGLIAYLLGSIPNGYIIGKYFHKSDIRTLGSGNVGSTNVLRNYGKKPAIITLILDMLKGYLAVFIGEKLAGYDGMCVGFLLVVIGHMYSVFLKFKAGKGVATSAGAMLFVNPMILLIGLIVFILTVVISKMVSLGSILGAISVMVLAYINYYPNKLFWTLIVVCLLIIYKHRSNIKRIINREESKIR